MMSRVSVLIIFFTMALHVSAFAVDEGSTMGGIFSGFLKKSEKPYRVSETLIVPEGKSLVVESGVVIEFSEGAGLDVRGGSLAVMGEPNSQVVFKASDSVWNGISLTGNQKSEIQDLRIENAEYGIALEKGAAELKSVTIEGASKVGLFVKEGVVDAQWISVNGSDVGVWGAQGADVRIASSQLEGNRIGLVSSKGADINMQASGIRHNEVGVFSRGDQFIEQRALSIEQNTIGVASELRPGSEFLKIVKNNEQRVLRNVADLERSLGEEPSNPYAGEGYSVAEDGVSNGGWTVSGNIIFDLGYHLVHTSHNWNQPEIVSEDTIYKGDRYKNYFQVPGLFANWIANVVMESPDGRTIEISTDISSDRWNAFNVHSFQAVYTDQFQRLALGDQFISDNEIALAGVNVLGGSYGFELFKNAVVKKPMFEVSVFGGEVQAPKIVGERGRDMYNVYIEDGDALAQKMILGSQVRWNMHPRFDGALGFVGSKDYLEDPFLRDGMSSNTNTSSPLVSSRTFFADGNWLMYPGDIKLNGQVAVGMADTSNAAAIRALNSVFADAGLDASNFALLNRLMNNPSAVSSLSREQLESIFGDNSMKTPSQMRSELRSLLSEAKSKVGRFKNEDARPTHSDFWNYKNWAVAGSFEWSNENTFIEGYFRYVGAGYYSAGSADLLQNTRLYGGNLKQKIFDFWKLSFGYDINVENAADGSTGYNIFGLGEGSTWGLTGADDSWLKAHSQDDNRTQYIHDAYLGNEFKILDNLTLFVKYGVNYRTRNTPLRLHSSYSIESGIYEDSWFKARTGRSTLEFEKEGSIYKVDSARWVQYYSLNQEEYLASQFEENLLKQTFELDVTFKFSKNVLKVGGKWILRSDLSEFEEDNLLDGFDFSDETYGILGYYFHGGDYFEQRYPVSLTSTFDEFRNTVGAMIRHKTYNRDDMTEFEWNLSDNVMIPLKRDFLELTLAGGIRQYFLDGESEGTDISEMEVDMDGSASLRIYHTTSLFSDWTLGCVYNYRPDNRADQYKDFFTVVSLNYSF